MSPIVVTKTSVQMLLNKIAELSKVGPSEVVPIETISIIPQSERHSWNQMALQLLFGLPPDFSML